VYFVNSTIARKYKKLQYTERWFPSSSLGTSSMFARLAAALPKLLWLLAGIIKLPLVKNYQLYQPTSILVVS